MYYKMERMQAASILVQTEYSQSNYSPQPQERLQYTLKWYLLSDRAITIEGSLPNSLLNVTCPTELLIKCYPPPLWRRGYEKPIFQLDRTVLRALVDYPGNIVQIDSINDDLWIHSFTLLFYQTVSIVVEKHYLHLSDGIGNGNEMALFYDPE